MVGQGPPYGAPDALMVGTPSLPYPAAPVPPDAPALRSQAHRRRSTVCAMSKKASSMALKGPALTLEVPLMTREVSALMLEAPAMPLKASTLPHKGASMALEVSAVRVRTLTHDAFCVIAAPFWGNDWS